MSKCSNAVNLQYNQTARRYKHFRDPIRRYLRNPLFIGFASGKIQELARRSGRFYKVPRLSKSGVPARVPWVRIPPCPPHRRSKLHIACSDFFCFTPKVGARSFRCSASPQTTRFAGLARGPRMRNRMVSGDFSYFQDGITFFPPFSAFSPSAAAFGTGRFSMQVPEASGAEGFRWA